MKPHLCGKACDEQGGESVRRFFRNEKAAPNEQDKECDKDQGADESELLADDGEDEVVLRLRKPQMLLVAVAEADAEKPAGADGEQAFIRLKALVEQMQLRMQPCIDACLGIVGEQNDSERRSAEGAGDAADPFDAGAGHENHTGAEEKEDNRARHVLFQRGRGADQYDHACGEENPVFEGFHFRCEFGYVKREQQNQGEFHDFGGLKLDGAYFHPSCRALGRGADAGDKDAPQQEIGYAENRKCHLFEKAVIDDGHAYHREDSENTPDELFFDEVKAVAAHIGFRIYVARGGHHDGTEADEKHHQNQKGLVNAAADAVDRRLVGGDKLMQKFLDRIFMFRGCRHAAPGMFRSFVRICHLSTSFTIINIV